MAKVKLGAIVVDMSGKLGGHVFAKNKGGNYMRTKTTPSNPQTSYQSDVRAMFATISQAWGGLTEVQRASFRDKVVEYSRTNIFGDLKNPTGKALFQRLNQNLTLTSQANLTIAPSPAPIGDAGYNSATFNVANSTFYVNLPGESEGDKLMIFATPKLSQGTKFVKNKLRLLEVAAGVSGGEVDIATSYTARFGALTVGDNVYIAVKSINSVGGNSPLLTLKATIVAGV